MPEQAPSKVALDTSFIIAALQSWHENHTVAFGFLERLFVSRREIILPVRVLVESFSVMTRLPMPHRLASRDAFALLEKNFRPRAHLVGMPESGYWDLLGSFPERGISGGIVYDAEIVECAQLAGAREIVTFNGKHFELLVPDGIGVVVPGAGRDGEPGTPE